MSIPMVSTASPRSMSQAQTITALKAELRRDGRFSGAVLIARNDRPVFEAAYGYANRAKNIANTIDTKFHYLAVGYTMPGLHVRVPGPGPGAPMMRGRGQGPGGPGPMASGPLQSTKGMLPYRGTSAGGGYSTVGDFLKFAAALRSHKLLDAHYTELLTSGEVLTPRPGIKYAFGFEDETTPDGVRLYGHGGGSPGMNGRLSIFRKSRYVVVVLANLDPPAADAMAQFIDERLPAE